MTRSLEHVLSAALLAGMVACILVSGVFLAGTIEPEWDGSYLVLLCGLAAVEAYGSRYWWARGMQLRGRLIEVAALLIAALLALDAVTGQAVFQEGVPRIDLPSLLILTPVLVTWLAVGEVSSHLHRLERPVESEPAYLAPERRVAARLFAGGVLVFVLAGLTQASVGRAVGLPEPAASGPLLNVLLYFGLAMLLLAQMRFASLERRWRVQQASVAAGLAPRWLGYSLGLVALIALLALAVPARYGAALDLARALWEPFLNATAESVDVARGPLLHLLSLLGGTIHPSHPRITQIDPSLRPPPGHFHLPVHLPVRHHAHHAATSHGPGGLAAHGDAILKTLLFWGAALGTCGFLLRRFLRRPAVAALLGRLATMGGALRGTLLALLRRLRRYGEAIGERVARDLGVRLPHLPVAGRVADALAGLGGGSPRARVIRSYLHVLKRAEQAGASRPPAQTPREFQAALAPSLGEARADLGALTEAFLEARYSRRDIGADEASSAGVHRRRITSALRQLP